MKLLNSLGWGLALLASGTLQADMLQGLKAYEEKQYSEAQQHFAELLPLGNELAAFNLGAMAYQGEGQPQDLVKALAYFMLAAELNHSQGEALLEKLSGKANSQQLAQAKLMYEQLIQQVVITHTKHDKKTEEQDIEPVKRVNPDYPRDAARKLQFGYVALRYLVDETGKVTAVDTMDAFPENTFEKVSVKAVKKWRYAPTGKKHVQRIRMEFSLSGRVKISQYDKIVNQLNLWDYAIAGSPSHQLVLGTLLSLAEVQSENALEFDAALPLLSKPDYSIYQKQVQLKPDFDDFWGRATVKVDAGGVITEQLSADFAPENQLDTLVGQQFKGDIVPGKYRLTRLNTSYMRNYDVTPLLTVSNAMSGMFWWEQAAKNGNLEAQRIMAAYQSQWENYLLAQQDAEVMAWTGTRLMLEGQRERGMQLLEQAIAKNYQPAKEMKQQFM